MAANAHIFAIISGSISDREVISASVVWFLGSRNPNKLQPILYDYHVTLKIQDGRQRPYICHYSRSTSDKELISASRVWFLVSRNPTKLFPIVCVHHMTL